MSTAQYPSHLQVHFGLLCRLLDLHGPAPRTTKGNWRNPWARASVSHIAPRMCDAWVASAAKIVAHPFTSFRWSLVDRSGVAMKNGSTHVDRDDFSPCLGMQCARKHCARTVAPHPRTHVFTHPLERIPTWALLKIAERL